MAHQTQPLEVTPRKHHREAPLTEAREPKKPTPLKPVPAPDEDVLCYLPIG